MKQVKGVKGTSALATHKHFNLGMGAVIDVMQCVYLGVMDKTIDNCKQENVDPLARGKANNCCIQYQETGHYSNFQSYYTINIVCV